MIGPSGCGKSTLLRIIAGLGEASSGTINWRDDINPAIHRGNIGFVFQDPTLMPWATVRANVRLPHRIIGSDRKAADEAVAEALELVGLADFADAYPRELSGGMRMRVSIARALSTKPRILLLDEPFAALDEITRFRLNDELLALWQRFGWTIVFVSHSVFESVYLSERILVMTPRPGTIGAERIVGGIHPHGADYRTSAEYNAICRDVSDDLNRLMASDPGAQR